MKQNQDKRTSAENFEGTYSFDPIELTSDMDAPMDTILSLPKHVESWKNGHLIKTPKLQNSQSKKTCFSKI